MRIRYYLLSSFIAIIGFFMFTTYHAHAWSGTEVDIQAEPVDATQHQQNIDQAQPTEMISLMGDDGQVRQMPARVMTGKSVRLAFIPLISRWGIAIGADATYYYFGGFTNGLMLIAGTNTITMPLRGVALDGNNLAISDDITRDITPIYNGLHQIIRYDPNYDSLHFWLQYRDASGNMQRPYIYNQVFSQNRRFGVFWLNWQQFVRVDFKTGNALAFANRSGTWYDGIYASRASAITNDGRYVFMDDGASLIDISGNCGFTINPQAYTGSLDRNFITCPEYPLNPTSAAGYDAYHTSFYLAPDERSATYVLQPYPYTSNQQEPKRITLSPKTNSVNGIEYLALGDSYSSGEGDIGTKADGTNFYLPLTDATPNTCHISSRSYPFLLRDNWGIPSDQMYSVACSGAQVVFEIGRANV